MSSAFLQTAIFHPIKQESKNLSVRDFIPLRPAYWTLLLKAKPPSLQQRNGQRNII